MSNYLKKNYFLLANFDNLEIHKKEIENRLKNIHNKIYDSVLYSPINKYDPLELFSIKNSNNEKYFRLKDYGYILKAKTNVDTSNANKSRLVYNKVNLILKDYSNTIVFAPFFYLVENSSYIKSDAQNIMMISTILLLLLYFVILKNRKLFFNTILAIVSSILSAILLTSLLFEQISILALVFGISITTISIDYMFHYYFHNDFIKRKFIIQKRVIFGFITTFGVFIIFSFIDIELFSQLAIFCAISLLVAFIIFSCLFVYLDIKSAIFKEDNQQVNSFNPLYIVIVSISMLIYVYNNLSFDNNLKNLDYQNEKLISISKKFKEGFGSDKYQSVIISAKNEESVLQKYEELLISYPDMLGIGKYVLSRKKCEKRLEQLKLYNFKKVKTLINSYSKEIGFTDIFKDAYAEINSLECNMNIIEDMKFKIIKDGNTYYTMALVDKKESIKDRQNVKIVNLSKSLASDTKIMKNTLVNYMLFSILFIIIILFFIAKFEMFYPLTYLLFPISTVLFVISLLGEINIMHIFALVILLAIGIDYGIYMHKTKTAEKTKKAIKYALLSTFSGFGVLVFSSTVALHSIGLVITVGIVSIFFLLYSNIQFK
jgi:predicted exporter